MKDLQVGYDEYPQIESERVRWVNRSDIELLGIALTNKNLYCICKKSNGMFKKATIEQVALPLSDIKIVNGQAMAQLVKHEGYWCLQIKFRQGTQYFSFYDSPKKVTPEWIDAINEWLGTEAFKPETRGKRNSLLDNARSKVTGVVSDCLDAVDNTTEVLRSGLRKKKDISDKKDAPQETVMYRQPQLPTSRLSNKSDEITPKFCANCGSSLGVGAKFCAACGCKIDGLSIESAGVEKNLGEKMVSPSSQRQIEYVGKIYKCPHCGSEVSPSSAVCDVCGSILSGKQAVGSAKDFQQQILQVELNRQKTKRSFWDPVDGLDATDKQLITLIKTYPIPNAVDDIEEFFQLAISNINVKRSKAVFTNSEAWSGKTREKEISNAWVSKLQQIYKKAELYLPKEEKYAYIKREYEKIMKELKLL